MGFFDQLGDVAKNLGAAAGDLAKQVSDKTNDALEISKLNSKISAERVEIEKEKKKISETLIEKFAKGEEIPEEIKGFCEKKTWKLKEQLSVYGIHFSYNRYIMNLIGKYCTCHKEKTEEVCHKVKHSTAYYV